MLLTQGIDCSVSAGSSGCKSGVFGRGMAVDTKGLGDGIGGLACRDSLSDLLSQLLWDAWSTHALALPLGSSPAGSGAFPYLLGLDLGQRGQQGEQDIAHKFIIGGQVRLGICCSPRTTGPG